MGDPRTHVCVRTNMGHVKADVPCHCWWCFSMCLCVFFSPSYRLSVLLTALYLCPSSLSPSVLIFIFPIFPLARYPPPPLSLCRFIRHLPVLPYPAGQAQAGPDQSEK